jgi:hypothetical protein
MVTKSGGEPPALLVGQPHASRYPPQRSPCRKSSESLPASRYPKLRCPLCFEVPARRRVLAECCYLHHTKGPASALLPRIAMSQVPCRFDCKIARKLNEDHHGHCNIISFGLPIWALYPFWCRNLCSFGRKPSKAINQDQGCQFIASAHLAIVPEREQSMLLTPNALSVPHIICLALLPGASFTCKPARPAVQAAWGSWGPLLL